MVRYPVPAYLVETPTERILIDTGLNPDAIADPANHYEADAAEERELILVDGDHDLLGDGSIELLDTPGHTPGHQSVRIGDVVIGADVTHFARARAGAEEACPATDGRLAMKSLPVTGRRRSTDVSNHST